MRWHLDELYVKINGEMLESFVTKTRDKAAALRFMKKTLKRHGSPEVVVTDTPIDDPRYDRKTKREFLLPIT